jgi:hypothetical protein
MAGNTGAEGEHDFTEYLKSVEFFFCCLFYAIIGYMLIVPPETLESDSNGVNFCRRCIEWYKLVWGLA